MNDKYVFKFPKNKREKFKEIYNRISKEFKREIEESKTIYNVNSGILIIGMLRYLPIQLQEFFKKVIKKFGAERIETEIVPEIKEPVYESKKNKIKECIELLEDITGKKVIFKNKLNEYQSEGKYCVGNIDNTTFIFIGKKCVMQMTKPGFKPIPYTNLTYLKLKNKVNFNSMEEVQKYLQTI